MPRGAYKRKDKPEIKRDYTKKKPEDRSLKANDGAGRSRIEINWDAVDILLKKGSSGAQAAAFIGINQHTLYRRCKEDKNIHFDEYRLEKLEKGNAGLHAKQFDLAMEGDRSMLIWLGKNRLGQSDKFESKIDANQQVTQKCILKLPDNGRRSINNDVD